jgi:predicted O-methyltransferase YrrM
MFTYSDKYKFTESWFDPMIHLWEQIFKEFQNIESILEIGCYEGRATVWLCENVLTDRSKNYQYDIVDTFGGSLNESGMQGTKDRLATDNFIENNFNHNISFFPYINFKIHKGFSQKILPGFEVKETYDFIYIDASHRADDTFVDAYFAQKLLKPGGILIFDDFAWKDPSNLHPSNSPQLGVEIFNAMYDETYELIHHGYQAVFLKK